VPHGVKVQVLSSAPFLNFITLYSKKIILLKQNQRLNIYYSYKVPEVIMIVIEDGNNHNLSWIDAEITKGV